MKVKENELSFDLDSVATESEIEIEWDGRRLKPYGKSCRMAYTIQQMAKLLEEPCADVDNCPGICIKPTSFTMCEPCQRKAALLRRYKGEQP